MIMKSLHVRLVVVMQVYRSAQKTKLTWIKGKTLTDTVLQFHPSVRLGWKQWRMIKNKTDFIQIGRACPCYSTYLLKSFILLFLINLCWSSKVRLMKVEWRFFSHTPNSLCLANVDKSHKKVLFLSDFSIIKDSYPGCGIFLAVVKQLYMCL